MVSMQYCTSLRKPVGLQHGGELDARSGGTVSSGVLGTTSHRRCCPALQPLTALPDGHLRLGHGRKGKRARLSGVWCQ